MGILDLYNNLSETATNNNTLQNIQAAAAKKPSKFGQIMAGVGNVIADNAPSIAKIIAGATIKNPWQQAAVAKSLDAETERNDRLRQAYKAAQAQQQKDYMQQAKDQLAAQQKQKEYADKMAQQNFNNVYKMKLLELKQNEGTQDKPWNTDTGRLWSIVNDKNGTYTQQQKDDARSLLMANKDAGTVGAIEKARQAAKTEAMIPQQYQEEYKQISKDYKAAKEMNAQYEQMLELFDKGFSTGNYADTVLKGKQILNSFGIPIEGLAESETFKALAEKLVLDASASLSGPKSDNDIKFLRATVPSLTKSVAGNRLLIETYKAINDKKIKDMQLARDYVRTHRYYDPIEMEKLQEQTSDGAISDELKIRINNVINKQNVGRQYSQSDIDSARQYLIANGKKGSQEEVLELLRRAGR